MPGNSAGKGNPLARRVQRLRVEMLRAVSPDDVAEVIRGLVAKAKQGDVAAAREVLDRTLGRPVEPDVLARIAELGDQLEHARRMLAALEPRTLRSTLDRA